MAAAAGATMQGHCHMFLECRQIRIHNDNHGASILVLTGKTLWHAGAGRWKLLMYGWMYAYVCSGMAIYMCQSDFKEKKKT